MPQDSATIEIPLGIGYYTVPDAARLLGMKPYAINRWLGGYHFTLDGADRHMEPLWSVQLPRLDGRLYLGFRDLIELRFVNAFVGAGVSLKAIRACLAYARECANDPRPFSTQRFRTDGRTIYLDTLRRLEDEPGTEERELLDLKNRQYAFASVIEKFFKDLDIEADAVARWRPLNGKVTIVLDPQRSFGQPIATDYGIPTETLRDAVAAEGSTKLVSRLYELPESVVKDACRFEERLHAA